MGIKVKHFRDEEAGDMSRDKLDPHLCLIVLGPFPAVGPHCLRPSHVLQSFFYCCWYGFLLLFPVAFMLSPGQKFVKGLQLLI